MPYVFSPNGDGINNFFSPILAENIAEYKIQIFNRWGTSVYEFIGRHLLWDGHMPDGKKAADGVYFRILTYKNIGLNSFEKVGNVTLIGN